MIQNLPGLFDAAPRHTHSTERPISWHCPACNVWGQDIPPAACWACGTKNVERKFGPPLGDAHRSHGAEDEI
jgi:hypothetical protein